MTQRHAARDKRSRLARAALLGGLSLFLFSWAVAFAIADDRVRRGTTVGGVDVGGMTPERARARIESTLSRQLGSGVMILRASGGSHPLFPREVGLVVDAEASVDQLPVGPSWDPRQLLDVLTGPKRYEVVVKASHKLDSALQRIASEVDRPPVEGAVSFQDRAAVPVYPKSGIGLDVMAAREAVLRAYRSEDRAVKLPVVRAVARTSKADVDRAMSSFALPALSAPVTFGLDRARLELRPSEYAERLAVTSRDGRLVPTVDRAWLKARLSEALRRSGAAPREATVRIVAGAPRVVPGRPGLTPAAQAADQFLTMLAASGDDRRSDLPTRTAAPRTSSAVARSWRITEPVSSFTTLYPHADYRNVNIGRAASLINGTVVEPSDVFSLNRAVGERTQENGFAQGFIISDGIFKQDFGGGVSQVATTLFNAAFFAGLEDVEHKPHSFYIDRYPVGREATVAWPTVDLRFRNDTPFGVLIQTKHVPSTPSSSGSLTIRLWSTKVWDVRARTSARYSFTAPEVRVLSGPDCIPNTGYEGFQVDVKRIFRRPGRDKIHRTESLHTTYTPSDTVICR